MIAPEDGLTSDKVHTLKSREERIDDAVAEYMVAKLSDREAIRRKILEENPDLRQELERFFDEYERMQHRARPFRSSLAAFGLIGRSLGGYEILRVVGYGAMGVVYEAWHEQQSRRVALKVLPHELVPGKLLEERFIREGKLAGALANPCICPIHEVGTDEGYHFIAMQFVDGETLGDRIEASRDDGRTCCKVTPDARPGESRDGGTPSKSDRGAKDLLDIVALFRKLASALHLTHEKNVLHRDIKPSNIMVRSDDGEPVIVDFGLAREESVEASVLTESGAVVGTLAYMPSEQIRGRQDQVDRRSDVYALGVTLYECLTLEKPFPEANRHQLSQSILFDPPRDCRQINGHIPRDLKFIVEKAIDKDRRRRYQTAQEFADDLDRFLRHEPVKARPAGRILRLRRWSMRHPALATLNASVVLGLLVSLFFVWELSRRQEALERSHVETLVAAESASVPELIGRLDREGILRRLETRLRETADESSEGSKRNLHLALALSTLDPSWSDDVLEHLADASPHETQAAAKVAARHGVPLDGRLQRTLDDPDRSSGERLRSFVALSELRPPENLLTWIGEFSHWLQQEPRHFAESWLGMLRDELREPLEGHFRKKLQDSQSQLEADFAAWAVLVMGRDDPSFLVGRVRESEGLALKFAVEELRRYDPVKAAELIDEQLKGKLPDTSDENLKDAVAQEQARLAAALLAIAPNSPESEKAWDIFGHSRDPRIRTFLVSLLVPAGASAGAISSRLDVEQDPSARYALTLALGEFAGGGITSVERGRLIERLEASFSEDPAPGVHGAALWALRELSGDKAAEGAESELLARAGERGAYAGKKWRYTEHGHCLVEIEGRDDFVMGSPQGEQGRTSLELRRPTSLPQRYLMSTLEISRKQLREFYDQRHQEYREWEQREGTQRAPDNTRERAWQRRYTAFKLPFDSGLVDCSDPECPAQVRSWYVAMFYCQWLSEKEGMHEDEWCYKPQEIVTGFWDWALKSDYLNKRGYRLPTAAEWEYACRGGAVTRRHYGDCDSFLGDYAWFRGNSVAAPQPGGQLKPNAFGLFDCLGNVLEYCESDVTGFYAFLKDESPELYTAVKSEGAHDFKMPHLYTEARGGSAFAAADYVRPAYFEVIQKSDFRPGFRVVRTLQP